VSSSWNIRPFSFRKKKMEPVCYFSCLRQQIATLGILRTLSNRRMNNGDMKKCPYCAEMIKQEAVKCRYCGSVLGKKNIISSLSMPKGDWRRIRQGKKIAGVCTGIARQFGAPVMILPLRVFFLVSTLFYLFGPVLYTLLWILMPAPDNNQESVPNSHGSDFSTTAGEST